MQLLNRKKILCVSCILLILLALVSSFYFDTHVQHQPDTISNTVTFIPKNSHKSQFKQSTITNYNTAQQAQQTQTGNPIQQAGNSTHDENRIALSKKIGKAIKNNVTQVLKQQSASQSKPIAGLPRGSGIKVVDPVQQDAVNNLLTQLGANTDLQMDNVSGTLRHIDGDLEKLVLSNPDYLEAKRQQNYPLMAVIATSQLGTVLGLQNPEKELMTQEVKTDDLGFTHVTLNQQYEDIPVWGAQLKMHFNQEDAPYQLSGVYAPTPWQMVMAQNPISKEQAIQLAQETTGLFEPNTITIDPMMYWDIDQAMVDCYKVELSDLAHHWILFVSRSDGKIVHQTSHICHQAAVGSGRDLDGLLREVNHFQENNTLHMIDTTRPMYNPNSRPPSLQRTDGAIFILDAEQKVIQNRTNFNTVQSNNPNDWDPSAVSLLHNFTLIEDYYRSTFNRNSIDDRGTNIVGIIHARFSDGSGGITSDNAFWNFAEKVMVFGDGDRVFSDFPRSLDVAGHELTHGVIDFSAGLIYENQSGALNEHIADFFGTMIDRDEWFLGDNVTPGFLGLRDMQDPSNRRVLSRQPTEMSEFASLPNTPEGDFGGVHVNSGIPNRMSFLLAEGPQGIGRDDAEKIIYRGLTVYLTRRSQFIDYRRALLSSARDLFGENSTPVQAVASAFDTVGISNQIDIPDNNPSPGELTEGENLHAFLQARPELGTNPNTGDFFYNLLVFSGASNNLVSNRLLINSRPAFSGDGSWALFVDRNFNLILVRSDLTEQVISAQGVVRTVALSKDQRFIAFTTNQFDNIITIVDLETSDPDREVRIAEIEIPRSDGSLQAIDFSDVLTFNFRGDTLVFDALTTSTISTDEEIDSWGIYKLRISDFNVQPLIVNSPGEQFGNPIFAQASDNNLLADWIVTSKEDPSVDFYNIVSIDLNQNEIGTLQSDLGDLGQPTWNGSDDEYLYVRFDPTTNNYVLLQAGLSEDKLTQTSSERRRFSNRGVISFPIGFRLGTFEAQRGQISVPDSLTFSSVPVNEQTQNGFSITNTGDADFELVGLTIEGEAAESYSHQTVNQIIRPGEEVPVSILFSPIKEGDNPASLIILSSDVDQPSLEVRLNGVGLPQETIPPTNTPIPVQPTPTPQLDVPMPTPSNPDTQIPTPRPSEEQIVLYEFEQDGLPNTGWINLPGGFSGAESGTIETAQLPQDLIPSSADQRGIKITVQPGQVAFIFAREPFLTNGNPVLIRASIRSDSQNAAPALVAISGDVAQSQLDGSLATLQPSSLLAAAQKNRKLVMLYEPDQTDILTPAIQVASTSDTEPVTVWIDNLELRILFPDFFFEGKIFESDL